MLDLCVARGLGKAVFSYRPAEHAEENLEPSPSNIQRLFQELVTINRYVCAPKLT